MWWTSREKGTEAVIRQESENNATVPGLETNTERETLAEGAIARWPRRVVDETATKLWEVALGCESQEGQGYGIRNANRQAHDSP